MRLAERVTGLCDYGGGGYRQRLEDTIDSLLQTDWNALGRFGIRYILHWHLSNRLRVVELLKQRPELGDIPIERPIVITGLFRTGTTYLHHVLAGDRRSRVGHLWEFTHPVGRPRDLMGDEKWRRWRCGHEVKMDDLIVPEQAEVHRVTVDAFEEDFFLLENDMAIMKFYVGFGDFDYAMRMLDWDMVEPYQWHRRQLQILWAQQSAERWLLKCPWHLWNLEALLTVYPDAHVIQTHRDVVHAVGSQCSLSARIASKFRRSLDFHALGRSWLEYSGLGVERGLRARETLPAEQVYDVRLADMVARPLEVIEHLYRHFGLPFDDELVTALKGRIQQDPVAQLGEHEYDIADYGLTEAKIRDRFADYTGRFEV